MINIIKFKLKILSVFVEIKKTYLMIWVVVLLLTSTTACKKFVDVDPPISRVSADVVFSTNEGAISMVTGIYARMAGESPVNTGFLPLNVFLGLSADELAILDPQASSVLQMYYTNQLATSPSLGLRDFWSGIYTPYMGLINVAITSLNKATTFEQNSSKSTLNESVRKQLLGEMYFMRAFSYFYLVQLYGDVPLLTTVDYVTNSTTGRTPSTLVYEQMVQDLQRAQSLMVSTYIDGDLMTTGNAKPRVRPVKGAADALLARVLLYKKDYAGAEQQALSVIQNTELYGLTSLDSAFLANNRGAIWQLQPVTTGRNTQEAWLFKLPTTGPTASNSSYPVYMNPQLLTAFEANDQRKTNWIGSVTSQGTTYYYPFKYKSATLNEPVTEYSTVLRLAEQYLICAEARAWLGNLSGGDAMLNAVRKRAGLQPVASISQEQLLNAVIHERQVELFSEWGHRWLDLKRTGRIDAVMEVATPLKGAGGWRSYQQFYPILLSELLGNKALLGHQNPGY